MSTLSTTQKKQGKKQNTNLEKNIDWSKILSLEGLIFFSAVVFIIFYTWTNWLFPKSETSTTNDEWLIEISEQLENQDVLSEASINIFILFRKEKWDQIESMCRVHKNILACDLLERYQKMLYENIQAKRPLKINSFIYETNAPVQVVSYCEKRGLVKIQDLYDHAIKDGFRWKMQKKLWRNVRSVLIAHGYQIPDGQYEEIDNLNFKTETISCLKENKMTRINHILDYIMNAEFNYKPWREALRELVGSSPDIVEDIEKSLREGGFSPFLNQDQWSHGPNPEWSK